MNIPKDKLRKHAVFAILPFHCFLLWLFMEASLVKEWQYLAAVLLIFLIHLELGFFSVRLFSGKTKKVCDFNHNFKPYILASLLLFLLEFIVSRLVKDDGFAILGDHFSQSIWWFICAAQLLLSALVTYVTGAARTMLYHDENGESYDKF